VLQRVRGHPDSTLPRQTWPVRTFPWREKKCSSAYGGSGRESMVKTVRPSSAGPDSASQSTSESAPGRPPSRRAVWAYSTPTGGMRAVHGMCSQQAAARRHSVPPFRAHACPAKGHAPAAAAHVLDWAPAGISASNTHVHGLLRYTSAPRPQHTLDAAERRGSRARARALGGRGRLPPAGLERRAGLGRRRGGRRLALAARHGHVRKAVLHSGDLHTVLARLYCALLARVQAARRRGRRRLLACAREPSVSCSRVLDT